MSETWTTEKMRDSFTDGGFWPSDEFDRWLEQHDKEVARTTEQRIIKLLEDDFYHDIRYKVRKIIWPEPLTERPSTYHADGCIGCHAIALIKREAE